MYKKKSIHSKINCTLFLGIYIRSKGTALASLQYEANTPPDSHRWVNVFSYSRSIPYLKYGRSRAMRQTHIRWWNGLTMFSSHWPGSIILPFSRLTLLLSGMIADVFDIFLGDGKYNESSLRLLYELREVFTSLISQCKEHSACVQNILPFS